MSNCSNHKALSEKPFLTTQQDPRSDHKLVTSLATLEDIGDLAFDLSAF